MLCMLCTLFDHLLCWLICLSTWLFNYRDTYWFICLISYVHEYTCCAGIYVHMYRGIHVRQWYISVYRYLRVYIVSLCYACMHNDRERERQSEMEQKKERTQIARYMHVHMCVCISINMSTCVMSQSVFHKHHCCTNTESQVQRYSDSALEDAQPKWWYLKKMSRHIFDSQQPMTFLIKYSQPWSFLMKGSETKVACGRLLFMVKQKNCKFSIQKKQSGDAAPPISPHWPNSFNFVK